jgi:hypothetical protein
MNGQGQVRGLAPAEVLLLMAVIALAVAAILPGLHQVRQHAFSVACTNHLLALGGAHFLYAKDNGDRLPSSDWWLASEAVLPRYLPEQRLPPVPGGTYPPKRYLESGQVFSYIGDPDFYLCPSDSRQRTHRRAEPIDFASYGANEDIRIACPLQPYSIQDGLLQLSAGSPHVYLPTDSLRSGPSAAGSEKEATGEDRSSKIVLLMEEHEDNTFDDGHVSTREAYTDALTLRHGGKGKMFFFDQHIDSVEAASFNAANQFIRARYFIGQDIFQP